MASSSLAPLSLTTALACLFASLLLAAVALGSFGLSSHGSVGLLAAAFAVGACSAGAVPALLAVALTRSTPMALAGLLLSMLFRTGAPLALGLIADARFPSLAAAGVFGMTVACYLWILAVETVLSVRMIAPGADLGRAR